MRNVLLTYSQSLLPYDTNDSFIYLSTHTPIPSCASEGLELALASPRRSALRHLCWEAQSRGRSRAGGWETNKVDTSRLLGKKGTVGGHRTSKPLPASNEQGAWQPPNLKPDHHQSSSSPLPEAPLASLGPPSKTGL